MSVGRICTREVDVADPKETVWQAAERLLQRSVGTLVILNEFREPIGIVTDRDLVERVLSTRKDPDTVSIGDVMTRDVATVSEDTSIESALSLMSSGRFRRLPVVDADGKLVGLLSLDDVLILLAEEFTLTGQLLKRETPAGVAADATA